MKLGFGKAFVEVSKGKDVDVIVLAGLADHRARLDVGRWDLVDGWWVKRTKLRVWKNLKYGIYSPIQEIYNRTWTH